MRKEHRKYQNKIHFFNHRKRKYRKTKEEKTRGEKRKHEMERRGIREDRKCRRKGGRRNRNRPAVGITE